MDSDNEYWLLWWSIVCSTVLLMYAINKFTA